MFTFAHKIQTQTQITNFSYEPLSIQFSYVGQFGSKNDYGIVSFDSFDYMIMNLFSQFSIYYRVITRNGDYFHEDLLSYNEFLQLTQNDKNIFFKYDPETEQLINNAISVLIPESQNIVIQLFAKYSCEQPVSDVRFGHLSIINQAGTDTYIGGHLASLINRIETNDDLFYLDGEVENISLYELFANNADITFTYDLKLMKSFTPGYEGLFKNCTGMYSAPALISKPESNFYYAEMFMNCYSLEKIHLLFDSVFQQRIRLL